MSSGGTTTTSSNQPPQQYLDAYSNVMNQAQGVAATPYQNYSGQMLAGFTPMQNQGFDTISSAPSTEAPYLNTAAQDFTNAAAPVSTAMQPYVDSAQTGFNNVANTNLSSSLTPYQTQAASGFAAGSPTLTPTQYSADALQQYESPYTQSVVDATQAQFNQQNAQAQTQLQGNAASQGALGGDRVGVAQATLAGQQQMAQAPVIAGLENTGYNQAQTEFNTQQQTNLTAQQQTAALQQQAATGYSNLAGQSLTAAQQTAALQATAAQGQSALGQTELGASQAQGWLDAQSGSGMASLGNQALSGQLTAGNALLSAGATQQQQAQNALNIPYEQYQAQLSYPYQTTGWLANIAEGLGGSSGGTSSTTTPGASAVSQVAGAGIGTAGLLGATGAYGSTGWLTGTSADAAATAAAGAESFVNRGGRISGGGFAVGGPVSPPPIQIGAGVPNASVTPINVGATPGEQATIPGGFGVPDVTASVVPGGDGMGSATAAKATPFMKQSYPTTTTTGPAQDSTLGSILKGAGSIAASVYGGPAGGMAANALGSQVHFDRGGMIRGFDAGGATDVPGSATIQPTGLGVPNVNHSGVPTSPPSAHGTFGMPKPPPAAKPENLGQETSSWINDLKSSGVFKNQTQGSARGGSVPILPHGFAAGGSPSISVTTVPNAKGVGVPTMSVDPSLGGGSSGSTSSGSPGISTGLVPNANGVGVPTMSVSPSTTGGSSGGTSSGSASSQLSNYLAQQQAGAWTPPTGPVANPAPASTTIDGMPSADYYQFLDGMQSWKRGGAIRGFADGGDTGGGFEMPDDAPDSTDAPPSLVTNEPVGTRTARWWGNQRAIAKANKGFAADNNQLWADQLSSLKSGVDSALTPGIDLGQVTDKPVGRNVKDWANAGKPPPLMDEGAFDEGSQTPPPPSSAGATDAVAPTPAVKPPVNTDPVFNSHAGASSLPGHQDLPDLTGAAAEGFGAASNAAADANAPPGDSKPGSGSAPSGGFGVGARPHQEIRNNPSMIRVGGSPLPLPPPDQTNVPSGNNQQQGSRTSWIDSLTNTRAHQEDKANPWMALATAGFGMAASNSPHPLQNLGAGALAGIHQYMSEDQAAKQLAAKVDETRASLANAQAYHEATIQSRDRGQDMRAQTATDQHNNMMEIAMMRMAAAAAKSGEHVTTGDMMSAAADSLIGQNNPATGQPYTKMERFRAANGAADRLSLGEQRNITASQRLALAQSDAEWRHSHGDASLEQKTKHDDDMLSLGLTNADLSYYRSNRDPMGKPTVPLSDAHTTVQGDVARNRPGGAPPAQADAAPDPLGIR